MPTYLYHVTDDDLVPSRLGRELARAYRRLGADVTWVEVPAVDHLSGAYDAADPVVRWLAARLAEHQRRTSTVGARR